MNTIKHNISAMNSQRVNNINARAQSKTVEKLSSGFKVNRAADDAAGLSISEKMRKQIRGLTQASSNAQDGISMVQIADGALTEVHEMLQRGNELMVKAANGTLSDNDRDYINMEVQQLKTAIDQVATTTKFNEIYLFPEDGVHPAKASNSSFSKYIYTFGSGGITGISQTDSSVKPGESIDKGNALAAKIAGEYVPNAVNQIMSTFSVLGDAINAVTGADISKLKLELEIKSLPDGEGNTLAYVSGKFLLPTGTGDLSPETFNGFTLVVDSNDFTPSDVTGNNTTKLDQLESTLAHEMMHALMDVAFPAGMYDEGGDEDFPLWFSEGTAQLTGGGFPTNWNYELQKHTDFSDDDAISTYLKSYNVAGRPYGHGYLAAAYMGHIASGESTVSANSIATGMNRIFEAIKNNPEADFKTTVGTKLGGKTVDDIISDINGGTGDAVAFVKGLMNQVGTNGAGSVIAAGGLGANAQSILGTGSTSAPIHIDLPDASSPSGGGGSALAFLPGSFSVGMHVGADADMTNKIIVNLYRMDSEALGLGNVGIVKDPRTGMEKRHLTEESATSAINNFAYAIDLVNGVRSYYGAIQNRMEHTILNLDNVVENTTSSESAIRDTDMATEAGKSANNNILIQAGQQMMAQANKSNEGILTLMR